MTQAERKTGTDSIFGSLKIVSVPAFRGPNAILPLFHQFHCLRLRQFGGAFSAVLKSVSVPAFRSVLLTRLFADDTLR